MMAVRALSVLGRTLLRLAQSESTGTLMLREDHVALELRFEKGSIIGLGERRKRTRTVDEDIRSRSYKNRRALVERCTRFAKRPLAQAKFVAHVHPRHEMDLDDPFEALDLTLAIARDLPFRGSLTAIRDSNWVLSAQGQRLGSAALSPTEAAILGAFHQLPQKRGLPGGALVDAVSGHAVLRTFGSWVEVGLVQRFQHPGSCGVLLQRSIELRQHGEFSACSSRRILRRRAAEVHPDRFDPALESTSREVMVALIDAGERR